MGEPPVFESEALDRRRAQYRFIDRLSANFPSQIVVDVTEVCNLECVHCPHPAFKKGPHYSGARLDPALNEKLVHEVRNCGRGHVQYLRYTGNGEPLIHPQIFDMLASATTNSGVYVCLTTNGLLLDECRVDELLRSKIQMVDISIDAFTAGTYEVIRKRGSFECLWGNVLRLIKRRKERNDETKIVVSFVEQEANLHEAKSFEAFWRSAGADSVVIRRLHSSAGAQKNTSLILRTLGQECQRRPCLYPWERITLNPRGELAFCPTDWVHGSILADYRDTTIRELWQGPTYAALREAHLRNDFSSHGFCGQCPDWQLTRWPGEGRSYADMVEDFKREE